jgi:hypothetical protein
VANTLNALRDGAVGFIDWLDSRSHRLKEASECGKTEKPEQNGENYQEERKQNAERDPASKVASDEKWNGRNDSEQDSEASPLIQIHSREGECDERKANVTDPK